MQFQLAENYKTMAASKHSHILIDISSLRVKIKLIHPITCLSKLSPPNFLIVLFLHEVLEYAFSCQLVHSMHLKCLPCPTTTKSDWWTHLATEMMLHLLLIYLTLPISQSEVTPSLILSHRKWKVSLKLSPKSKY